MRRAWSLVGIALWTTGSALVAGAADPTAQELHFLYEVNRARNDPAAWAAGYNLGAETGGDGQPATLANVDPQPPLAWNPELTDSARFKAQEIADNDYSGHQSTIGPNFYWPDELARHFGYPLAPYVPNPAGGYFYFGDDANQIESLARSYGPGRQDFSQAVNAVITLIVDSSGLGHRDHMLAMSPINVAFIEAGAGYASNPSGLFRNYWAFHTGVRETVEIWLTGVAFSDTNGNTRFDPGEGLGGVTVQTGAASTVTGAAGGYSLLVADGDRDVACSGGGFSGSASGWVAMNGVNHELDCISGQSVAWLDFAPAPVPEAGGFVSGLVAAGALMLARRRGAASSPRKGYASWRK
jgi:hypothetical protein